MASRASGSYDKYDDLQMNIKFLKLIEKHECLWKHDSPHYTSNPVKVQAWKEIAKAVNGTEERCCRRWRYIRQTYSQYVRACYTTNQRKTQYYLSPHVDFVKPYVKLPPCVKSDEPNSEHNKDDSKDGCTEAPRTQNKIAGNLQNQKETTEENTDIILEKQFLELIEGASEKDTNTKTNNVIKVKGSKAASSNSNLKRKMEICATEPQLKHSKPTPSKSVVSKNWMFLESILPFVDEMRKKQIRRFRRKVMILLDDVLQNKNIDKPELVK